jgi:hypothetical protein
VPFAGFSPPSPLYTAPAGITKYSAKKSHNILSFWIHFQILVQFRWNSKFTPLPFYIRRPQVSLYALIQSKLSFSITHASYCCVLCLCVYNRKKERDIFIHQLCWDEVFFLLLLRWLLLVCLSAAGHARPLRIFPMYICTHTHRMCVCVCAVCCRLFVC